MDRKNRHFDLFHVNKSKESGDCITTSLFRLHLLVPFLVSLSLCSPVFAFSSSDIGSKTNDTRSVTLGDVDGDGDLDLVTGNDDGPNRLYINQGNGTGEYGEGVDIGVDTHKTLAVALGDVDGDGDLDLIAANNGEVNRLYMNRGGLQGGTQGDFDSGSDLGTDTDVTWSIALGDVDGDGDLDLVVGNYDATNRLYLNLGGIQGGSEGEFGSGSNLGEDTDATRSIALGDVDNDGDLDLVSGNSDQVNRLYLNQGGAQGGTEGHYAAGMEINVDAHRSRSIDLGDVDNDGYLDLIVGNTGSTNRLYLNLGSGSYDDGTDLTADNHQTVSVRLGDIDGDGDLDLIAGSFNGQTDRLYVNQGGLQGASTGSYVVGEDLSADSLDTFSVAIGDVNNNGRLDIVIGNYGQSNRLHTNDQLEYFDPGFNNLGGDMDISYSVAVGDLDGDGDQDLVTGNDAFSRIYFNPGGIQGGEEGDFGPGTKIPGNTPYVFSLALGDVDSDGDLDLVAGNYASNRLYLNQGGAQLGVEGEFDSGTDVGSADEKTNEVILADVDNDGDLDLIVANGNVQSTSVKEGQVNRLYLNQGGIQEGDEGVFGDGIDLTADVNVSNSIVAGDIDGDGDLDLIAGNYDPSFLSTGEPNRLYLNQGGLQGGSPGSFVAGGNFTDDEHNTYSLAMGDIDGDGDLDLVAGNLGSDISNPGYDRLYINQGGMQGGQEGDFVASNLGSQPGITTSVSLGDIDGDGDLDLAIGDLVQASQYRLNDGGSEQPFGAAVSLSGDAFLTNAVLLADINSDGDQDFVEVNVGFTGEVNRLYNNLVSQHHLHVFVGGDLSAFEETGSAVFSIDCFGSVEGAASLDYHLETGTASAADFTLSSGTLIWPDGRCVGKEIVVPLYNDYSIESAETFYLVLENPVGLYNKDPITQTRKLAFTILNQDVDSDGDGVIDSVDPFPNDPTETIDSDGDGIGDQADPDDDNDGVPDDDDAFPLDSSKSIDSDGDGASDDVDSDDDNDGVGDNIDAFPLDGSEYLDTDGDGIGNNADSDDDGDGVEDDVDAFPLDATETTDSDGDGIGNYKDTDDDNDGVLDVDDAEPLLAPPDTDFDNDGIANVDDADDDNDGVNDEADAFPQNADETIDTDGDGTGDNADQDDDNDGIPDQSELAFGLSPTDPTDALADADGDGINNVVEYRLGTLETDSNAQPSKPVLLSPAVDDKDVDPASVEFSWEVSTDADGEGLNYDIIVCENIEFKACVSETTNPSQKIASAIGLGGMSMLLLGLIGGQPRRRQLFYVALVVLAFIVAGCGGGTKEVEIKSYTKTDLNAETTYYWKVIVSDEKGAQAESEVRVFTTK